MAKIPFVDAKKRALQFIRSAKDDTSGSSESEFDGGSDEQDDNISTLDGQEIDIEDSESWKDLYSALKNYPLGEGGKTYFKRLLAGKNPYGDEITKSEGWGN